MHNVLLIARREYLERIRTRGFLVTTVMIPLVMAGILFGTTLVGDKSKSDASVAVVSSDTQLVLDLDAQLQKQSTVAAVAGAARRRTPRHIVIELINPTTADSDETLDTLNEQLDSGNLDGYLWIKPAASPGAAPSYSFTPRSTDDTGLRNTLSSALTTVLAKEKLAHSGIVASEADDVLRPAEIKTAPRDRRESPDSAIASITILFFLMYMVIMLYGMNVARSIIEEKTSRIFEVLLATIRPEEMMAGKILGVGSVGLTQVGIWLIAVLAFGTTLASRVGASDIHIALTTAQAAWFFVYFLLGYLFYSSIAAALGAMTNSEQELQQLNMFLVLPLAVCFFALRSVLLTPDGTLARVLALIPPFTPLLMYVRVALGHPSPIEIIASLVLTAASIYGIIWVTSRIYRVGVLMYGKRPNLPEILRWLKYS